ncbi:MAG: methyltransferase domain-containing protein [Candidatus Methanomethylophilaceae archaeon]|nr:methyltransferase domain-containing protein [Candidatus Methanomethylophilaceae archaeon]
MAFQENEFIYLEDTSGKRIWLKVVYGMMKVQSLGAIDGTRFKDLDEGDKVTIVGRDYRVFRPGVLELMESLDRGAQIISAKDAATILMHCDIKAGDRVIEVGAGSGGLTTALLHAVAPTGQVLTLEFKEENALRAKKNVSRVGLDKYWSYQIGDARDMSVDVDWQADALTMDMPDPWLALDNLEKHLRSGGRLCAYVPNMNQAESIVNALREHGYSSVYALENMHRGLEVHPGGVRPSFEMLGHTGYLIFARKTSQ